jgi:hypothetical protein
MSPIRVLPAVLVVMLIWALPVLAHASPPDPSWIPGLYDDGDYDDVVTLIVSATGHAPTGSPLDLLVGPQLAGSLVHAAEAAPASLAASAVQSRAPPTA